MGPLSGVRVLDFGRYIAGPYCGALLGEFGADVIRIEKRGGSEDRFVSPLGEGLEGAVFTQMNRNKRSMTLDPMSAAGREVVERLVRSADVVVANLPSPTLTAMGLDHASLSRLRPDIILASTSAYGDVGPLRDQVGFDGIGQVMSGAVHLTGVPEQPYRTPVAWVDFGTALHSAFGVVLALLERERSGRGQAVTTSLLGTALAFMAPTLIEQAMTGRNRQAIGNRSHGSAPTDLYRTRDGWILTQVIGQPLFRRWANLMGEPSWLEDARFRDDQSRAENSGPITERMSRWCAEHTQAEALEILGAARIPAGPVLRPQQVLDHPHVQAMGLMVETTAQGAPRPAPAFRAPVSLSETPGAIAEGPPRIGQHTEAILEELGYSAGEISDLRAAGAI